MTATTAASSGDRPRARSIAIGARVGCRSSAADARTTSADGSASADATAADVIGRVATLAQPAVIAPAIASATARRPLKTLFPLIRFTDSKAIASPPAPARPARTTYCCTP